MGNIIAKVVKKVRCNCKCISDCEISINKNSIKRKESNNNVNTNNVNTNNVVVNTPNTERRQLPAIPQQNVYTEIT